MDTNIGLPSEILMLCTSAETKEKALAFFEQIRRNKHIKSEIAMDPALPAVCSLIASEQLGNTVVSERRAQQWSRSTPEHFKTLKAEMKKILFSMHQNNADTSFEDAVQKLVREFELEDIFLEYMIRVGQAFTGGISAKQWRIQTYTVPVSIFMWICRRFKLRTKQPIDNLPSRYGIVTSDLEEIHHILTKRWPLNADLVLRDERSSRESFPSSSSNSQSIGRYRDNAIHPLDPTDFSQLVNDFELDGSIADGLHHLQQVIRQTETLKNLVDWDSTLAKCTIFYWTCSVLKITGIKHITVRTHYNVNKKDFDKLILALDGHRGDLRRSLEEFYARNVHLTDPFKPTQVSSTDRVHESSLEDPGSQSTGRSSKRGRPRRNKSPVSSLTPTSPAEAKMAKFCDGRAHTYKRALLMYRSLMARPLPKFKHIPSEELPSVVTCLSNEQVGVKPFADKDIEQMSALRITDQFDQARSELETLVLKGHIKSIVYQTRFDEMALEHGLCINTVFLMIDVCDYLRESRCLSENMNWQSSLVTCAIFFWTCAILQVPNINMNALRRSSQASKREFDTMLQLLNNHCSHIRQRLELEQKNGNIVSSRSMYTQKGVHAHTPHSELSQFSQDSGPDERPSKISKSEPLAFFNKDLDSSEGSGTFDEIIAREYREAVATRTREGSGNVPGSNNKLEATTVMVTSEVARGKRHLPAEGGADLTPSSMSNRKSGSDISCTVVTTTPLGDGGIAKNTRYSTQDYAVVRNGLGVWVPHDHEDLERGDQYHLWEQKMVERYGSGWEKSITRYKDPAVAFE